MVAVTASRERQKLFSKHGKVFIEYLPKLGYRI